MGRSPVVDYAVWLNKAASRRVLIIVRSNGVGFRL